MGWKWSFVLSNNAGKSCTFPAKFTGFCPTPPKSNIFRTRVSSNSTKIRKKIGVHAASTSNMMGLAKFPFNQKCWKIPLPTGNARDVKVKFTCLKEEKGLSARTVIMQCVTYAIMNGGKEKMGRNTSARKKFK